MPPMVFDALVRSVGFFHPDIFLLKPRTSLRSDTHTMTTGMDIFTIHRLIGPRIRGFPRATFIIGEVKPHSSFSPAAGLLCEFSVGVIWACGSCWLSRLLRRPRTN